MTHRRICELRDPTGPNYRPEYLKTLPSERDDADPAPRESCPPIDRQAYYAKMKRVLACEVRGAPIECGCQVERRYCGESFELVTLNACLACKA